MKLVICVRYEGSDQIVQFQGGAPFGSFDSNDGATPHRSLALRADPMVSLTHLYWRSWLGLPSGNLGGSGPRPARQKPHDCRTDAQMAARLVPLCDNRRRHPPAPSCVRRWPKRLRRTGIAEINGPASASRARRSGHPNSRDAQFAMTALQWSTKE